MKAYFLGLAAQFTNPMTAIAQILGFIPIILGFFIFRKNTRSKSIVLKATSDLISVLHFALLGQWTGCAINAVNVFRGICFYQKGRRPWASGIWMPIIFCAATVASSILSWAGPKSLLAMIGTCLGVMGYWCKSPENLRKFNFAGISLWTIYGVIVFSVPTIVGNLISLISITITQIRVSREKKEKCYDYH